MSDKNNILRVLKTDPDAIFKMPRLGDAGYDLYSHTLVELPPMFNPVSPQYVVSSSQREGHLGGGGAGGGVVSTSQGKIPGTKAIFSAQEVEAYKERYNTMIKHHEENISPVIKIPTGIRFQIPTGYFGLILDKSSIGSMGIKSFAGVIDETYRGEVKVCLGNMTSTMIQIGRGTKIAQIVFIAYARFEIEFVDSLDETERGEGGFGSTGLSDTEKVS